MDEISTCDAGRLHQKQMPSRGPALKAARLWSGYRGHWRFNWATGFIRRAILLSVLYLQSSLSFEWSASSPMFPLRPLRFACNFAGDEGLQECIDGIKAEIPYCHLVGLFICRYAMLHSVVVTAVCSLVHSLVGNIEMWFWNEGLVKSLFKMLSNIMRLLKMQF